MTKHISSARPAHKPDELPAGLAWTNTLATLSAGSLPGPVEAQRRQRPQRMPLLREALADPEAAGRVQATVAGLVAPVGVLAVEPGCVGSSSRASILSALAMSRKRWSATRCLPVSMRPYAITPCGWSSRHTFLGPPRRRPCTIERRRGTLRRLRNIYASKLDTAIILTGAISP